MATRKRQKKSKRKLNIWRLTLLIILLVFVVGAGAGVGFVAGIVRNMPDFNPGDFQMNMTTFVYDDQGHNVVELHGPENRIPVQFSQMPSELKMAFLAIEDVRFYEHYGVDPKGIFRAVVTDLATGSLKEGASTITQQLARNAFMENPQQTFKRKIQEAVMALQLERTYSKDEIFEYYLNLIYFGEGAYGVEAAAQTYFGKHVQNLTLAESATLAGIVKSTTRYDPFKNPELSIERRNLVLDNMAKYQMISSDEAEKAKKTPLELTDKKMTGSTYKYPYFIDYVISSSQELLAENGIDPSQLYYGGLRIYTTLDTGIQKNIEASFQKPDLFPPGEKDQMPQAAMVVMDPATGEVRGLMGGREHVTQRGLNRAVRQSDNSGRQPGSAFKPLAVYGAALQQGYAPASVIDDVPTTFQVGKNQEYTPRNYDNHYRGLISMREALRWSINVAAVKWLDRIGVDTGYQFAQSLGLPLTPNDKYLSMALGGLSRGVTPMEMAGAYATFDNAGVWIEPHVITRIEDADGNVLADVNPQKRDVMTPQNAYLMTDMLQTVVQAGTGTRARLNRPTAGKTGTVQLPPDLAKKVSGTKDAWFAGYTPELVGVVWMGYDITDAKHYLKGVGGSSFPAMLWKDVMQKSLEGVPVKDFTRPNGIIYSAADAKSGLLPSELTPANFVVSEIFTKNNMPKEVSNVWVKEKIDPVTGQLANEYCPNPVEKIFLQRPVPYTGNKQPEDANLEAPKEVCTLHGPGGGALKTVYLCTNPAHFAPVLALIPKGGQKGGCPPSEVTEVQLPSDQAPAAYCSIPEHQLIGSVIGSLEDINTGPGSGGKKDSTAAPAGNTKSGAMLYYELDLSGSHPAVALSWEAIDTSLKMAYVIERRQDSGNWENMGLTTSTNSRDTDVQSGHDYSYRIYVVDRETNQSTVSNTLEVTIP